MRASILRLALALALALVAPMAAFAAKPAAKPAARPAAAHNWLATANRTPDGAIVIGNPAAKVKIVEYLSMTCPHCAALSGEALKPLQQNYIAKGVASLEVRHAVRDGYDMVASLLARCQPAADYLPAMEGLFANQEGWMTLASAAKDDPGFEGKTPDQQMAFVAKSAGFDRFFTKRGMSPKRYAACMADKAGKDQLVKMAENSWERDKIPGTPAIMINGELQQGIVHWADLEARLKAALH